MSQIHVTRTMSTEHDASQFHLTKIELSAVMAICVVIGTLFGAVFGMAVSAGPPQRVAGQTVIRMP